MSLEGTGNLLRRKLKKEKRVVGMVQERGMGERQVEGEDSLKDRERVIRERVMLMMMMMRS